MRQNKESYLRKERDCYLPFTSTILFDLLLMTITNQSIRVYVADESADAAIDTYYQLNNDPRIDYIIGRLAA